MYTNARSHDLTLTSPIQSFPCSLSYGSTVKEKKYTFTLCFLVSNFMSIFLSLHMRLVLGRGTKLALMKLVHGRGMKMKHVR